MVAMNNEINILHQPELTPQAEPLWDYLDRAYGVPTVELWETLNEKAYISIDYWNTILPRFRRQATNIALISSLLIGNGNQNVIAQEIVADDTSTNVVCLSNNQSTYCYYMAIALNALGGPSLPTPAPTPTASRTPTATPTLTPTPTATPLPARWFNDIGDREVNDCGLSGCRKLIFFDQLGECYPITPLIDENTSNYLGDSFNTFDPNYRPVLRFNDWDENNNPGFIVDKEFDLFGPGFNKQPSNYELIVNCGGGNN
jgi:hypothetical protein